MNVTDHAVLQRDPDNRARIVLDNGKRLELPIGGPFQVGTARDVLVGDLWVLAGQSNMEGVGDLVDVETPASLVHSYSSSERWGIAEEPLHCLDQSPRLVHHRLLGRESVPNPRPSLDPKRSKGAGLGLSFAKARLAQTGVPVGLIPCAHGGTAMSQWQPGPPDDATLYGAMLARIQDLGGQVAGVLWYQGESDAMGFDRSKYSAQLTDLLERFRSDLNQPDLPFLYVQIGSYVTTPTPDLIAGWNAVREAQRHWVQRQHKIAVVSAIDLELDDLVHIGTQGLKRLGRRLALAAEGHGAPSVQQIWLVGYQLRVRFGGVRGQLRATGRPSGFSLRDRHGNECHRIYKVTLESDTVVLHLTEEPLPSEVDLWYGWGLTPYCNLTDTEDMALAAFGPLSIPEEQHEALLQIHPNPQG